MHQKGIYFVIILALTVGAKEKNKKAMDERLVQGAT